MLFETGPAFDQSVCTEENPEYLFFIISYSTRLFFDEKYTVILFYVNKALTYITCSLRML